MSDEQPKRDDELGALWVKTSAKGNEFMTGSVICSSCQHKQDIILFKNQFKTKDNHPVYRILKSREQGERHTHAPSTRRDERPRPPSEEFDSFNQRDRSGTQPKAWPQKVQASKQAVQKVADDWTTDIPLAMTDEDIGF